MTQKANDKPDNGMQNIDYQSAQSPSGGSYTEKKLQRLNLPSMKGKRFLDLGCNAGFHCRYALAEGAAAVTGVDNSPRIIEKARSQSDPAIVYRDTGWDDFPTGVYDIVILLSAIHYAKNPRSVTRNIARSLSPDGLLVLEGGILFSDEDRATDIPLPGWRRVGDRCLHLTKGFIEKHLLVDFDWKISGESEFRGGDDVARYVIHARPNNQTVENNEFDLDILDFFAAAAKSAATIVEEQPAHIYVAPLRSQQQLTPEYISAMLQNDDIFEAFIVDLTFSLSAINCNILNLHQTISREITSSVAKRIDTKIEVRLT